MEWVTHFRAELWISVSENSKEAAQTLRSFFTSARVTRQPTLQISPQALNVAKHCIMHSYTVHTIIGNVHFVGHLMHKLRKDV